MFTSSTTSSPIDESPWSSGTAASLPQAARRDTGADDRLVQRGHHAERAAPGAVLGDRRSTSARREDVEIPAPSSERERGAGSSDRQRGLVQDLRRLLVDVDDVP